MSDMDYLFVMEDGGGWRLKVDSMEKLTDYFEHTLPVKYEGAINLYRQSLLDKTEEETVLEHIMSKPLAERIALMKTNDFRLMYAAILLAEKQEHATFLDGFRLLNLEVGEAAIKNLRERGAVYFNSKGGKTHGVTAKQFCRRKNLIFPQYKESDIRISQFTGGTHYYAYVGDMQIGDGKILKWNSYEEAYKKACEAVRKE